jgi:hypothetical protein
MLGTIITRAFAAIVFTATFIIGIFAGTFDVTVRPVVAQEVTPEIESRSDQFDVPYVPSTTAVLDTMYNFTKPTQDDYIMDLGSGDGRIVLNAAKKFGASGHGMDLNEGLVAVANARARSAGIADRATFYVRDLFKEDISKATIVTMYLLPEVVMQLRPKLFNELKPGTRIASHDYHMGDWRFDAAKVVDSVTKGEEDIVYYWKVPAKVAGIWTWEIAYPGYLEEPKQLRGYINQHYQDIDGRVNIGLLPIRIHDAKMDGAQITFSITGELDDRIVRQDYTGTVSGNRISGTVRLLGGVEPKTFEWSAFRSQADN